MMIGTSLSARSVRQTSMPESRGIITSRMTRSNRSARAAASASSPSVRVSTSKPSRRSA
jgi:hypothetical protein